MVSASNQAAPLCTGGREVIVRRILLRRVRLRQITQNTSAALGVITRRARAAALLASGAALLIPLTVRRRTAHSPPHFTGASQSRLAGLLPMTAALLRMAHAWSTIRRGRTATE